MANHYRSVLAGGAGATGDAVAADVLTGKTFSNASAVGIAGAMPNNGAVSGTATPNQPYTIPAGYHNGSGVVNASGVSNKAYLFYVNNSADWGVYELNANPTNPTTRTSSDLNNPISIFDGDITCDAVGARQPRITLVDTTKTYKVLVSTGIAAYSGYPAIAENTISTLDSSHASIGGTNISPAAFVAVIYKEL